MSNEIVQVDRTDYVSYRAALILLEASGGNMDVAVEQFLAECDWQDKTSVLATQRARRFISSAKGVIASLKRYDLRLVGDYNFILPLCVCESTREWEAVVKSVFRMYSGTFKRLELPRYHIVEASGAGRAIPLSELTAKREKNAKQPKKAAGRAKPSAKPAKPAKAAVGRSKGAAGGRAAKPAVRSASSGKVTKGTRKAAGRQSVAGA